MSSETELVVQIMEALAAAEEVDEAEINYTLSDAIDPEILLYLEKLDCGDWSFTFCVSDHHVTVTDDSGVFVDGDSYESDVETI